MVKDNLFGMFFKMFYVFDNYFFNRFILLWCIIINYKIIMFCWFEVYYVSCFFIKGNREFYIF